MSDDKKMTIFRLAEAKELLEADVMAIDAFSDPVAAGFGACMEAGYLDGTDARVLFSAFGFSLIHVWFKRSFPLPLHSHDVDCVYYIIGGDIRLGTQTLKAGEGFFVPAGMPYTYKPGVDGVELLEIRNNVNFNYHDRSSAAFWKKALKTVEDNRGAWINAERLVGTQT